MSRKATFPVRSSIRLLLSEEVWERLGSPVELTARYPEILPELFAPLVDGQDLLG
jgi:hypothetical protein